MQRLRDARIVHGWIESFDRTHLVVRYANLLSQAGDRFQIQCDSVSGTLTFAAILRNESKVSSSANAVAGDLRRGVYEIDGPVTHHAIASDPRYLADGRVVYVGEYEVECHLLDVSPNGLAVSSPVYFPGGIEVKIKMETTGGLLETHAEVRYSRRPTSGDDPYRVGMRLTGLDRVSRARWIKLLP